MPREQGDALWHTRAALLRQPSVGTHQPNWRSSRAQAVEEPEPLNVVPCVTPVTASAPRDVREEPDAFIVPQRVWAHSEQGGSLAGRQHGIHSHAPLRHRH